MNAFGQFMITQSTVDIIISLKNEMQGIRSKGYLSLGMKEGEYFGMEVTQENITNSLDFLDQLINIINLCCDIVPLNPKTIENVSEYSKYKDLVGKSFIDTILLSEQEDRHVYTDDNVLRGFIYIEFAKISIWTQFLLQFLLRLNKISLIEYNSAVIKLSDMNYYHTSIDANILIEKGKQMNWIPHLSFKNILKILNGSFSDEFPSSTRIGKFYI